MWLHGNPFCTTLPTLPIILVKNKPEIIYAEEVEGAVLEDLPASAYTTFRLLGSMSTPPPLWKIRARKRDAVKVIQLCLELPDDDRGDAVTRSSPTLQ